MAQSLSPERYLALPVLVQFDHPADVLAIRNAIIAIDKQTKLLLKKFHVLIFDSCQHEFTRALRSRRYE